MNARTFSRLQSRHDAAEPAPDHLWCVVCGECADKYGKHPKLDVAWCSEECHEVWKKSVKPNKEE